MQPLVLSGLTPGQLNQELLKCSKVWLWSISTSGFSVGLQNIHRLLVFLSCLADLAQEQACFQMIAGKVTA